uniref:PWWP domain-containing protein n=1 Tax=Kalanchoe fedtschenkoi TaxID=63787 RepID=A0A7N0UQD4_KALFE
MKRKHPSIGMNEVSEEGGIVHEFCKPSDVVKLGYLIWVKLHPSSWWPAQVVDAETVSEFVKPIERLVGEVLVRVYGSYIYLYVDPTESRIEFEKVLKRYDGNYDAILEEALAKDRPRSTKSKVATLAEASQSTGSTLASAAKCGKKNKSAEKKTAAVDKETSTRLRKRVSHKGKPARKMSESNESSNLGSEVSSPTPVEKTSATNQQSQSMKTETEAAAAAAFLHSENRGKIDDENLSSPCQAIVPIRIRVHPSISVRSEKIMRSLGLIAPSGSPFDRKIQHS